MSQPRRGRGRGGNSQTLAGNPQGPSSCLQQQTRSSSAVIPPRMQAPRPQAHRTSSSHAEEQFSEQMSSMNIGSGQVNPVGRGAVRGNRPLEGVEEYYRLPRPESSKTQQGKQGISGQPVKLLTNYFPITSYTNWSLYQYRVDFSPEEDRIGVQKGLLYPHKEVFGSFLYDGTMLFCSKKLESNVLELTSKRTSDDQIVIITITFTRVVETGDYANIQIFNLLLRNCLRHLKLQLVGRNYYDAKAKILINRHNLELWPGYETTIGMFDSGLLLRSEISTKVMRQETVYDFFLQCQNERTRNSDWLTLFKTGVIGTVVMTKYNNQTYKVDDIDDDASTNSSFLKKDGTRMTYAQYYQERWQLNINGVQPMLVSKTKTLLGNNTEEKLIYLVPQFCHFTGITDAMRNNRSLMKDMSAYTRIDPQERINRLLNFSSRLLSTPKSVESLKEWNLCLKRNLIELTGRVLPIEEIWDNTKKISGGKEADWTKNLRNASMFKSASIKRWVILTPSFLRNDLNKFTRTLQTVLNGMSFRLPAPEIIEMRDGKSSTFVVMLEQIASQINPSLVLCVVPSELNVTYNVIKKKLCIDRAIPSQVVTAKNVKLSNMSVVTKIAIQINCKLGGAPWLVKIPAKGLMIMGFDVCHDTQNKKKSYGALVATMNDTHTAYYSVVQPHNNGEELSTYFSSCTSLALHKYFEINKALPNNIIVYRDGVGDGQLSHVHKYEVTKIKEACAVFYKEKSVPLAFVVVKKRISSRFYLPSQQGAINPVPGTVIDNTVTDPTMYDFFLVSQHVQYGTVSPTHYNVIEDSMVNWSPDRMQKLTYKLCHMYYNWSGTVRVPAPCQLAHKLAFFCAQTLKGRPNPGLDQLLYFL